MDKKLEQHTNAKISPIILLALLDSATIVLNNKQKITSGSEVINDLILMLIEYSICCIANGKSINTIAQIIASSTNGIL